MVLSEGDILSKRLQNLSERGLDTWPVLHSFCYFHVTYHLLTPDLSEFFSHFISDQKLLSEVRK